MRGGLLNGYHAFRHIEYLFLFQHLVNSALFTILAGWRSEQKKMFKERLGLQTSRVAALDREAARLRKLSIAAQKVVNQSGVALGAFV